MPLGWNQIEPATDDEYLAWLTKESAFLVSRCNRAAGLVDSTQIAGAMRILRRIELDRARIAELEASNAHLMKLAAVMSDPMGF